MAWTDDPEVLATFRAEVADRVAAMRAAVAALGDGPRDRTVVAALLRDAHTLKGSARMLGVDALVDLAHRSEDLLAAVRDGRAVPDAAVRAALEAVLDAVPRTLPDAVDAVTPQECAALVAGLAAAAAGTGGALEVPEPAARGTGGPGGASARPGVGPRPTAPPAPAALRVPATRVHDLLDQVGSAETAVRDLGRTTALLANLVARHEELLVGLRAAVRADPGADPVVRAAAGTALASAEEVSTRVRTALGDLDDAGELLAEVRTGTLGLAMVPLSRLTAGFPRLVRELADATGVTAVLRVEGSDVEIDVRVLDAVSDALRHLVTNAVDHGCRPVPGRPGPGTVTVSARSSGSTVSVAVSDDGPGIDRDAVRAAAVTAGLLAPDAAPDAAELLALVLEPGLTTRATVSESSGRGVGLDVVRASVAAVGGTVTVRSEPGRGTRVDLVLPVTVGVSRCLIVRAGGIRYALPLVGVSGVVPLTGEPAPSLAGAAVLERPGGSVPLVDLATVVGGGEAPAPADGAWAVLGPRPDGRVVAWRVGAVEEERELLVHELGAFLGRYRGIGGGSLEPDGSVLLVVDLRRLPLAPRAPAAERRGDGAPDAPSPGPDAGTRPRVLVVEDSPGVRELERAVLHAAGYDVATAADGLEGARYLRGRPMDLVLADVEMPGMDGLALTRALRATRGWEDVPVVILTSRAGAEDRRAGLAAGADAYLLKARFDVDALVATVRRLTARPRPPAP